MRTCARVFVCARLCELKQFHCRRRRRCRCFRVNRRLLLIVEEGGVGEGRIGATSCRDLINE